MYKHCVYVIALMTLLSSCGDFLEESSQNLTYVHSTRDLDELLIGNGYMQKQKSGTAEFYRFMWLDVMDDDVSHVITKERQESKTVMMHVLREFYKWNSYPYDDDQPNYYATPTGWHKLYECIGMVNVILGDIERFKEEKDYRRIKGEALFLRGFYYFYLVNLWGAPYDPETAATDLGVPLKLTDYIEDKGFQRNTVEECYQQIVTDLKEAVDCLEGVVQSSTRRADQRAARALLARTYLYLGQYALAVEQCNAILETPGDLALTDMNTMSAKDYYTLQRNQTFGECIFTNSYGPVLFQSTSAESLVVSQGLLSCYDAANDLRFQTGKDSHFFRYYKGNYYAWSRAATTEVYSLSLLFPEIYLNKAEALAMLGQEEEAIRVLQELREKRMRDAGTIALSGEELVKFIREERRRELCFRGLRWFDLRRYAVHPRYPQKTRIEHPYYDWNGSMVLNKIYVLEEYPGDGGWLMPFPKEALLSNEGALLDNVRPER